MRRVFALVLVVVMGMALPVNSPVFILRDVAAAVSQTSQQMFWKYEDLKSLDPWGDSDSDARDIVAVYVKEGSGAFYFRVDLLDLRNDSKLNLYFAIDYKPGGETEMVSGNVNFTADVSWDLLVVFYNSSEQVVFDAAYMAHSEYLNSSEYESELDYVEFSILKVAFAGWDGKPFNVQAFVTDSGSTSILDKTAAAATDATAGRAKLVLCFGNMFIGYGPNAISWYDGFALADPTRPTERCGLKYLLDAVEKYEIPLTTIDARVDVLPGNEYLGVNDRLRDLADKSLLEVVDTLSYGYYMPWQPKDVDLTAIMMMREYRERLGLPKTEVFYPYEGWLTVDDLESIKEAGYPAIYALDRYGYWFGWIRDWNARREWYESTMKVHIVNGVKVLFGLQGFAWDSRWDKLGIEPGWGLFNSESFIGTDKGLHHGWRRVLLDMALDPDQEKFRTMGTDLMLTLWQYEDIAEWNLRWLANHPWIEVTTFSNILHRNWTAIDHGYLDLASNQSLDRYPNEQDMSSGAYFWQYYYGGISDGHSRLIPNGTRIEGYFDYVPYLRDGQLIPSGMKMGDDKTPGTIIYETLRNLRTAPNNSLTTLAWLSYFVDIEEQTFHAKFLYTGGEEPQDDPGGQYLHPGARLGANYVRQVNKIVAAANWAEEVAKGMHNSSIQVLRQDLDLDGEDEYVMKNDKVFAVFENDGGRLEYAFAYDPSLGPVQLVAPTYQQFGVGGNYEDGETASRPTLSRSPVFWDAAFTEKDYEYSLFDVSLGDRSLTFTSKDGKIAKTFMLIENTIYARYSTQDLNEIYVGFGLPVNMGSMYSRNWGEKIVKVNLTGGVGWKNTDGGYAVVNLMDTSLLSTDSFTDSPAREEMRERGTDEGSYPSGHWFNFPFNTVTVAGKGNFNVSLTLSATLTAESNTTLSADPLTLKVGKTVTLSGKLTTSSWVDWSLVTVALEYTKPDGSFISRDAKARSDGSFSDSFTPTMEGTWSVKAKWNGTVYVLKSESQPVKFTAESLTTLEILTDTGLIYLIIITPILAIVAVIVLRSRKKHPSNVRNVANSGSFSHC